MGAPTVELRGGDWRVLVRPAVGGSIARFDRLDGRPIFQPAGAGVDGGGCFPLVPFGNRVRDRRFTFDGRRFHLDANLPGGRVVHGFGWQAEWALAEASASMLMITHRHDGSGGWPWPYDAEQRIGLDDDGLRIGLRVVNRAATPMPAGLGLHPFFPAAMGKRLSVAARHVAAAGADGFPAALSGATSARTALAEGLEVASTLYLSGIAGPVTLGGGGRPAVVLSISETLTDLVVYRPPLGDFLCIEPMTHGVGALGDESSSGLAVLAPGAALTASVLFVPIPDADAADRP